MTTAIGVIALTVLAAMGWLCAWCRGCDLRAIESGKGATDWIAHGRMIEQQADRKRRSDAARLGHLKRRERAEAREGAGIAALIEANAELSFKKGAQRNEL